MGKRALVYLAASLLTAGSASAQVDDWPLLIERGQAMEAASDYAGALVCYEDAVRLAEQRAANDPRRLVSWNSVATMYDALGRFPDAERSYRRALDAAEHSRGKDSLDYAVILGSLGSLYIEMGQTTRGERMLREAIGIQEALDRPNESRLATARVCLAETLLTTGKYEEPERLLTSALVVWERQPESWSEQGVVLNNLGVVRFYQRRYGEAQRLFERSLGMMETAFSKDHPMLVRVLNNMATLFSRTGHRAEAIESLRRALAIAEKSLGVDHPVNGILLRNYAALLRKSGDKTNARKLEARSAQVLKESALRSGTGMSIDISAFSRK